MKYDTRAIQRAFRIHDKISYNSLSTIFNILANIKLHFFVRVRCLMNCSFSGITCQRPNVTPPLKIVTDTNKQTFDYNDTIEFRCPEGYNMNGKAVQHCTQNGILQQNLPTCLRMYFISTLKNRK